VPARRRLLGLALGCAVLAALGCSPAPAGFKLNYAYLRVNEVRNGEEPRAYDKHYGELNAVLVSLFGTPDDPHVPALPDVAVSEVLDADKIKVAAGPVRSDRNGVAMGLFREHCVHCHGVTGDGAGPTAAFLNPYPRDFRKGVFKFKSTPKGEKPTHEDLKRILLNGIPGTAMPSFGVLPDPDLEALVNYVKYLSIRGEVERKLIESLFDVEGDLVGEAAQRSEKMGEFSELAAGVVNRWAGAAQAVTTIEGRPAGWDDPTVLEASKERGRKLFYGDVANCVKCHGESQLGDGVTNDFDDWAKDFLPPNATAEQIRNLTYEFTALGALEPRNIMPRNLRRGVFRGGRRPIDIYWRTKNGIDGTPMPAALMKPPGAPADTKGLTEEDLWALIDYVRNLQYEPLSEAPEEQLKPENPRELP
jgi:mono/diheme cytochrome c family protein